MISDEVRKMLARRCRSRRTRQAKFSVAAPIEWSPTAILDPGRPGTYFTEDRAWTYIADAIDAGHPIEIVELRKPAGKKGLVLLLVGARADEFIYVKLQLGPDKVIGRSFHISKRTI